MDNIQFKIAEERTAQLIESIYNNLKKIKDGELIFIIDEFKKNLTDLQKKIKLEIAFHWAV